jgi:hypothetical protein
MTSPKRADLRGRLVGDPTLARERAAQERRETVRPTAASPPLLV